MDSSICFMVLANKAWSYRFMPMSGSERSSASSAVACRKVLTPYALNFGAYCAIPAACRTWSMGGPSPSAACASDALSAKTKTAVRTAVGLIVSGKAILRVP
jgi:hypothetical protein